MLLPFLILVNNAKTLNEFMNYVNIVCTKY